ncbi:MAG: hypothetical protein V3R87_11685 [Dehalococcoidia bacterium]
MTFDERSFDADHLRNFQGRAAECVLSMDVALRDIADSMDEANEAVAKFDADRSEQDRWSGIAGAWSRWWSIFLRQYGTRCFGRWRDRCGNLDDYGAMEELWAGSFVPLQVAGCEIVKQVRLKQVRQEVTELSRHSGVSRADRNALLEWSAPLDDTLSRLITSHTELQKMAITRSLRDEAEQDKGSTFAKLKRFVFGKG